MRMISLISLNIIRTYPVFLQIQADLIYPNQFVLIILQIWNKNNDEEVILEELFANKEAANIHLKKYSDENDMSQKSYQIEKYVVNQKYWIDGYITC